jgi:hypothetical protein
MVRTGEQRLLEKLAAAMVWTWWKATFCKYEGQAGKVLSD